MASFRTKYWWPYLAVQAVGLFHLFYLLPLHYRHVVGRWVMVPVFPPFAVA